MCGNTSDRVSDQNFTCKDFQEPYYLCNPALSQVLFGHAPIPSEFPDGQLTNEEPRNLLVAFCLEAIERIRSNRTKRRRLQ